jgi:membrane protein
VSDARPTLLEVARESGRAWSRGGARLLSGAVAFYALLSLVPVFILAIQIAGAATNEDDARQALLANLTRWVGPSGGATVSSLLGAAGDARVRAPWGLQVLVLGYASTRLFSALQRSLHLLWEVPLTSPERFAHKVVTQLRRRGMAFALVGVIGLILVALVLWNGALAHASHLLGAYPAVWRAANAAFSFGVTWTLFAAIFKVLPEATVSTRDAAFGAFVTTVLFSVGAAIVGAYVGHKAAESFFGAASSVVMLLLWVNYSAQVFFLGAAFTGVHARMRGDGIHPRTDHPPEL